MYPLYDGKSEVVMTDHKKKKILLVSASIGTGHMQAAKAIEEYWHLTDPEAEVKHIDFLAKETLSFDTLIKETYIKIIDIFPMLYDLLYRLSQQGRQGDILQTTVSWMMKNRMLKLIRKEKPDVLVFTHPFPCGAACILKRQHQIDVPIVGVITDFTVHQFWVYPQVDVYCVGIDSLVDTLSACGVEREKIVATGMPIRRAYFDRPVRTYTADSPTMALVMGGGLGLGAIHEVVSCLSQTKGIDGITVVAGRNESLYENLMELRKKVDIPIKVYGYTTKIPKLMRKASILFTKPGGLTCREAIAMGIPMVFYNAIPGQEECNAELFERLNCARSIHDMSALRTETERLLSQPDVLQAMSDAGRTWSEDGAANIGTVINRLLAERIESPETVLQSEIV